MDAKEKQEQVAGFFLAHFMETARLAKTADEKRCIMLAMVKAVDAAYSERSRKTPREANFETVRRFAEGSATLSALHEAGRRVRSALGEFSTNPKTYAFATAVHWLANVAVATDEESDGGFKLHVDELPFIMGWITYGRPNQDASHWEENIATALVSGLCAA